MSRLAAAGRPLHHEFADRAAAVDGEMFDVIGNIPLVWAFCGIGREHSRLDATIDREMAARRRSLYYLEKLRLFHAAITVVLTIALLAWAIVLWQHGAATAGDVVLVCTLGLSILHATRDLAVALVDVTQHLARLAEALGTLLVPHHLCDHPQATSLARSGATVTFENIAFSYPDGRNVFTDFSLRIEPGQRIGLVGQSGCGKSTLFSLLQRFYDVQGGRILLGGQDIARVTQESLRAAIAVVPQDISIFHRSIMENIRYGRPDASDVDVHEAIVAANCGNFIENLPEGVATIVGDRGVKLSPGQRQRIGIARAFLKDAPILLLDEATSALDRNSEEAVRGIGSLDGRPNRHRNRTPAVELAQFRSDRRAAGGTGLRGRSAAGAGAQQRRLLQLGAARGGAVGETGCLARNTASSKAQACGQCDRSSRSVGSASISAAT
jgi:ATP-binding cassette, subfamily B, bacterial